MKTLKDLNRAPPGGWWHRDPETHLVHRENSLPELVSLVDTQRANNKLDPLPDTQAIILDQICSRYPSYCKEVYTPPTIRDYYRGAKALVKSLFSKYVEQSLADARAQTCLRCDHNKPLDKHSKLRYYTDQAVVRWIGDRKTPYDKDLFTCAICHCILRVKVHFDQKLVDEDLSLEHRIKMPNGIPGKDKEPLYCWCIRPDKVVEHDN